MKVKKIREILTKLKIELDTIIMRKGGPAEIIEATDLSKSDISDYKKGRKNWSWEKILNVGEKMGL